MFLLKTNATRVAFLFYIIFINRRIECVFNKESNIDLHDEQECKSKDCSRRLNWNISNFNYTEIHLHQTMYTSTESTFKKGNDSGVTQENFTCFDDNLPCNISREEYMRHLYEYLRPGAIKWILILSHTIVFLIGLIGNALVCIAVYTNYSMRTVTNIFIVNLAIADFLVILVCLPPSVVWDITETWFLGETMCKVVLYFQTVSVTVSILTLTLISIDRWYAICFPLRYRTKVSRAITSVLAVWIFAIILDIPEFLALTVRTQKQRFETILFSQCITTWTESTERNFYISQFILLFICPLLLMVATYTKIVSVLWKSNAMLVGQHQLSQHLCKENGLVRARTGTSNRGPYGQLQARRKAAKMMVVVVIMFAICYFPIHIFNLLRYSGKLNVGEVTKIFALCSHWLCYANSAINPMIYNFMSGKFRREFRNVFTKCRCSNVRVEDKYIHRSGPFQQNNSISMRCYNNLTGREFKRLSYIHQIASKREDSQF